MSLHIPLKSLSHGDESKPRVNHFSKDGKNVKAIFYLTDKEQYRDLQIETLSSGIKKVTISKSAFTYASPLVGNLDGIRVRFYSKRLYNAVVK